MFVDDLRRQRPEVFEAINIARVHQHRIGQRPWLCAICLVGLIEQRTNLRIVIEHDAIEMSGQCLPACFKDRYGGFNDVAMGSAEHNQLQSEQFLYWSQSNARAR